MRREHTHSEAQFPRGRVRLAALLRGARDVIQIDDTAQVFDIPRNEAAKLLSRWAKQGWALFSPAYIGGRTAAEHWDLTEQIFRDIVVVTARPIRHKSEVRHGAEFTLKHVGGEKIFGTKTVATPYQGRGIGYSSHHY